MIIDLSHWRREGKPRIYEEVAPTLQARDYKEPRCTIVGLGENKAIEWREDEMNGLKVNDFFCGAGGMGLGFKQAGFEIAGAWDFDKYAVESYRANVGDHVQQADVTQMTGDDVPQAEVWTFGFPCQDLSVAGQMKGLYDGERSRLFFEIMRLLGDVSDKPSMILAENVKGLKKYLPVLEEEYTKAGYRMLYTLFNSKYWGVAQNRERYFVAGIRNDLTLNFQFPEQQTDNVPRLLDFLEEEVDETFYLSDTYMERFKESLSTFKPMGGDMPVIGTTRSETAKGTNSSSWVHETNKRIGTLSARDYKQPKQILEKDFRIRKLTPREYARLQGFPDSYKQVVSNTQFYKQMGNAVTVNVAYAIAKAIKECLS